MTKEDAIERLESLRNHFVSLNTQPRPRDCIDPSERIFKDLDRNGSYYQEAVEFALHYLSGG